MEDQEVRKSVVRISFKWISTSKYKKDMVIAGIILKIDNDGNALIAAHSTFFGERKKFSVNFPNAGGYEDGQNFEAARNPNLSERAALAPYESVPGFYVFTAKPRENGYIEAVKFENQAVKVNDLVDSFVFPREGYITPTGYCSGSITNVCCSVLQHDCDMHEYGYLGSPLFNSFGNLVGITYLDQGHYQAWTVWHLRDIFKYWAREMVFVSGNGRTGEEAQVEVEEPAGADAQVEE